MGRAECYSYTFDPQGSLGQRQAQGNGASDATDTLSFDAYGARLGDVDAAMGAAETYSDPAGFGGQWGYQTDRETGLSLLRHRYYDTGAGRFLSRDPAGYGGGMNLYGYAGNNPVNDMDPDGYADTPIDLALNIGATAYDGFKLGWDHFHHGSAGALALDTTALTLDGIGFLPGPPGGASILARVGGREALLAGTDILRARRAYRMANAAAKPAQIGIMMAAGIPWEEAVREHTGGIED